MSAQPKVGPESVDPRVGLMTVIASAGDSATEAEPVLELAKPRRTVHQIEAAEMNRWMIWFGVPMIVAAIFVGITFDTGHELWLGGALGSLFLDIFVLVWLAMSSDTNGVIGEIAHH